MIELIMGPVSFARKIAGNLRNRVHAQLIRQINRRKFEQDYLRTLPEEFHPVAEFLYLRKTSLEDRQVASKIEAFRQEIPLVARKKQIDSFASPHSGTFALDEKGRAAPGPVGSANTEEHAGTGVDKRGGILLRKIGQALKISNVLELGTNTGFSACYFLSIGGVHVVTVEGSADLCRIAQEFMERFSTDFRLMNMLFDYAIDDLQVEGALFDCVFIDGQHEREATLHYTERVMPLLKPEGAIVYDDIYWSDGMNQAWRDLQHHGEFVRTLDFEMKGICIRGSPGQMRRHHDICDYLGRPAIFRKDW